MLTESKQGGGMFSKREVWGRFQTYGGEEDECDSRTMPFVTKSTLLYISEKMSFEGEDKV